MTRLSALCAFTSLVVARADYLYSATFAGNAASGPVAYVEVTYTRCTLVGDHWTLLACSSYDDTGMLYQYDTPDCSGAGTPAALQPPWGATAGATSTSPGTLVSCVKGAYTPPTTGALGQYWPTQDACPATPPSITVYWNTGVCHLTGSPMTPSAVFSCSSGAGGAIVQTSVRSAGGVRCAACGVPLSCSMLRVAVIPVSLRARSLLLCRFLRAAARAPLLARPPTRCSCAAADPTPSPLQFSGPDCTGTATQPESEPLACTVVDTGSASGMCNDNVAVLTTYAGNAASGTVANTLAVHQGCAPTGNTNEYAMLACNVSTGTGTLYRYANSACTGAGTVAPNQPAWGATPGTGAAPGQSTTCVAGTYAPSRTGLLYSAFTAPKCPATSAPVVYKSVATKTCFLTGSASAPSAKYTCSGDPGATRQYSVFVSVRREG